MRVAVDVDDRVLEVGREVAQRGQEVLEAVRLTVGLGERLRIA
jgi:hypothetical protein